MGHIYTVGETPVKTWRRVPGRIAWALAAVALAAAAAWTFAQTTASSLSAPDDRHALGALIVVALLLVAMAYAAYRGSMGGKFADEHPALFIARPARSDIPTAPRDVAAPEAAEEPAVVPAALSRRFCPYCGERTEPEHRFCAFCGQALPPAGGSG